MTGEPWYPLPPDEAVAREPDCSCGHHPLNHYGGGGCNTPGCSCTRYTPDPEAVILDEDEHGR